MRLRENREDMDGVGGVRNDVTIVVILEILKNKINVKGFHFIFPFSHFRPLSLFHNCSVVNSAAINTDVWLSLWCVDLESWMNTLLYISCFNFHHTVTHSDHSHSQRKKRRTVWKHWTELRKSGVFLFHAL